MYHYIEFPRSVIYVVVWDPIVTSSEMFERCRDVQQFYDGTSYDLDAGECCMYCGHHFSLHGYTISGDSGRVLCPAKDGVRFAKLHYHGKIESTSFSVIRDLDTTYTEQPLTESELVDDAVISEQMEARRVTSGRLPIRKFRSERNISSHPEVSRLSHVSALGLFLTPAMFF